MRGFSFQCCCPKDPRVYDIYGSYDHGQAAGQLKDYFFANPVRWEPGDDARVDDSQTLSNWSVPYAGNLLENLITLSPHTTDADFCMGVRGRTNPFRSLHAYGVDVRSKALLFDRSFTHAQFPGGTRELAPFVSRSFHTTRRSIFYTPVPQPGSTVWAANTSTLALINPNMSGFQSATFDGTIIEFSASGTSNHSSNTDADDWKLQTTSTSPSPQPARAHVVCPRAYPKAFGVIPPPDYIGDTALERTEYFAIVLGDLSMQVIGQMQAGGSQTIFELSRTGENLPKTAFVELDAGDTDGDGAWCCAFAYSIEGQFTSAETHSVLMYNGTTFVDQIGTPSQPGAVFRDIVLTPDARRAAILAEQFNYTGVFTFGGLFLLNLETGDVEWAIDGNAFDASIVGVNEKYLYVQRFTNELDLPGSTSPSTANYRIPLDDHEALEKFFPESQPSDTLYQGYTVTFDDGKQVDAIRNHETVNALINGE